jgi:hypothetical protein
MIFKILKEMGKNGAVAVDNCACVAIEKSLKA